ncbi:hypothetical protein BK011_06780 [Tenericutes bacterium MZ-XQ]|nr:hypothetical protein BK011_06780 [Tenericutes bacterium MZ-XQ]
MKKPNNQILKEINNEIESGVTLERLKELRKKLNRIDLSDEFGWSENKSLKTWLKVCIDEMILEAGDDFGGLTKVEVQK